MNYAIVNNIHNKKEAEQVSSESVLNYTDELISRISTAINSSEDMGKLISEIENCQQKIEFLIQRTEELNSEINCLTTELAGLMAFGKQDARISEIKERIIEKTSELSQIEESKLTWLNKLGDLGKRRIKLQEELKKQKMEEKQLRICMAKAIAEEQKEMYRKYNQLEQVKKMIEEGHDFSQYLVGNELRIENVKINI